MNWSIVVTYRQLIGHKSKWIFMQSINFNSICLLIFCLLSKWIYPYLIKKNVKVSNCSNGYIDFNLQFCFHFMYFDALLWCIYMLRIIMPSWQIDPFIIMQCHSSPQYFSLVWSLFYQKLIQLLLLSSDWYLHYLSFCTHLLLIFMC